MAEHEAVAGEGVAKSDFDGWKEGGGWYKVLLRVEREDRRRQLQSYSFADQQFFFFRSGSSELLRRGQFVTNIICLSLPLSFL